MEEDQGSDEEDDDIDAEDRVTSDSHTSRTPLPQEKLWVDKYTPRQYTDLLSEEVRGKDHELPCKFNCS